MMTHCGFLIFYLLSQLFCWKIYSDCMDTKLISFQSSTLTKKKGRVSYLDILAELYYQLVQLPELQAQILEGMKIPQIQSLPIEVLQVILMLVFSIISIFSTRSDLYLKTETLAYKQLVLRTVPENTKCSVNIF